MEKRKVKTEKTGRYFTHGKRESHIRTILFVCHGYAQNAEKFLEKFSAIFRDDIFIVAPEGLNRFYARETSGKTVASWMTSEEREDDIKDYIAFLDRVYSDVIPDFPKRVRIIAIGFSQGAATASRWITSGRSRIDELVLWCGFFPPDEKVSEIPEHVQVKLITATDDRFVTPEEEKEQVEAFKKIVPGLGYFQFEGKHEINPAGLEWLFPEE